MRRFIAFATLAALAPAPAMAQQPAPISAEAQQTLKCAIFAAVVAGASGEGQPNANPDLERAMGFALTYWIGQFEGMTGRHFDEFATVEFARQATSEMATLQTACVPPMQSMGDRLQSWGTLMQSIEDAPAPAATPAP